MSGYGGSNAALEFHGCAASDIVGQRVESKICELCGQMFFRAGAERECRRCAAEMSKPKEPALPLTRLEMRQERMRERQAKMRRMREAFRQP